MTHKDIYTKFMIEYDKANVTSSYPSLTEYEVATVLDKAYNALIAQKVTGNNVRRSAFETDIKAIADIQPLVKSSDVTFSVTDGDVVPNRMHTNLDDECLYFLEAYLKYGEKHENESVSKCDFHVNILDIPSNVFKLNHIDLKEGETANDYTLEYSGGAATFKHCRFDGTHATSLIYIHEADLLKLYLTAKNSEYELVWVDGELDNKNTITIYKKGYIKNPYDGKKDRMVPTLIVNHNAATKFFASAYNMPWIKIPVSYIEDDILYVVYDLLNAPAKEGQIVYIKKPNPFVKELSNNDNIKEQSYFDYDIYSFAEKTGETQQQREARLNLYNNFVESKKNEYTFECNDTVAEELISLAIAFALENIESPRLNTKLNMRGLEA